ncbi:MAG TPA: class III extradiol ring-cleavage dioxygenase [Noviherbaspirillum sp.]|nr:class III extradiol ring-cleavage dioxygenase [Noviherbaspirillum sp.]
MNRLPTLFVSHGSPMLAIEDSPASRFLRGLGNSIPRPRAILMASAHWESQGSIAVNLAERPETIHDFGGFPLELYRLDYPAPGAPEVAEKAASLLEQAGYRVVHSASRGLDHGAWVPLRLMYPDAGIPVTQISIMRGATPAEHEQIGRALASLREDDVLVIGSGSLTHNLYEFRGGPIDAPAPEWVSEFATWMEAKLHAGDRAALLDYRSLAPSAVRNHPTEEHLLPLYVAMGAAGADVVAERIHSSNEYGVLAMDVYAFR